MYIDKDKLLVTIYLDKNKIKLFSLLNINQYAKSIQYTRYSTHLDFNRIV